MMSEKYSTAAVILAAGSSSRMQGGRHKLLLPLADRPVLAHVIEVALASQRCEQRYHFFYPMAIGRTRTRLVVLVVLVV